MARSFGQVAPQSRRARGSRRASGTSSALRPVESSVRSRASTAMTTDLLLEAVGDGARLLRDLGGIEPARSLDVDRVLLDDATRPAREQDDAIAEAHRFANVV